MSLRQAAQQAFEAMGKMHARNMEDFMDSMTAYVNLQRALEEPAQEPLTDEEIKRLAREEADLPWNVVNQILESNFVRAIERAHGIGGEA